MAKPYIKLDWDWREDPKVMLFEERYGKPALVDLIQLFCLMSEFAGSIDMADEATQLRVQKVLRKKAHGVEQFIEKCADCGLVSSEAWFSLRRIGSDRSVKDGEARRKRRDYALAASAAASEAAEKRRDEEGDDADDSESHGFLGALGARRKDRNR